MLNSDDYSGLPPADPGIMSPIGRPPLDCRVIYQRSGHLRVGCRIAVGTSDPEEATRRMLTRGVRAAVVKLGRDGVLVTTSDGNQERIPPFAVQVVCGLGAGDAFGGAFCHGLLNGWTVADAARYGNAAGAIVASRLMCADDMPTLGEIETFLSTRDEPYRTGVPMASA